MGAIIPLKVLKGRALRGFFPDLLPWHDRRIQSPKYLRTFTKKRNSDGSQSVLDLPEDVEGTSIRSGGAIVISNHPSCDIYHVGGQSEMNKENPGRTLLLQQFARTDTRNYSASAAFEDYFTYSLNRSSSWVDGKKSQKHERICKEEAAAGLKSPKNYSNSVSTIERRLQQVKWCPEIMPEYSAQAQSRFKDFFGK